MTTTLPNASQQAAADGVVDRADLGTGTATGKLRICSGAQPADADSAPGGVLLCEIDLANPAFGNANSSGTAAANGMPKSGVGTAAAGDGTDAQSFRVVNRDGATVYEGKVTGTAGDGELKLDNVNIAEDQAVTVASLTYTQPAG